MSTRTFGVVGALFGVATSAAPQQSHWTDPAAHATRFVTVADDVRLEVLDWGGAGPPLVLLAGLGDTGHVFDELAPMLAARYRVLAVTRRGHGRSSAPTTGYGFQQLADDVLRVIDTIGVQRPVIVGHSFAGEEMHVLGARNPAPVAGLIYMDAAFDRADGSPDYDSVARTLPPTPRPTPADLASFAALRSFVESKIGAAGTAGPRGARYVAKARCRVGG
jgi:pimeloyl-ACP methyl ester carboxylesterase